MLEVQSWADRVEVHKLASSVGRKGTSQARVPTAGWLAGWADRAEADKLASSVGNKGTSPTRVPTMVQAGWEGAEQAGWEGAEEESSMEEEERRSEVSGTVLFVKEHMVPR